MKTAKKPTNRIESEDRVVKGYEVVSTPEFPDWFTPYMAVPAELGGGWIGMAKVKQLLKMTPKRNPSGRDDYNDPRADIPGLVKSIETVGLNQFPTTNSVELIDGVRRTTAAGWMEKNNKLPGGMIPVLYRPKANAAAFPDTQAQNKKHQPFQLVETWLNDPTGVTWGTKRLCEQAAADIGRGLMKKITLAGRNVLSMLSYARRAYEYCQPETPRQEFLQKAVKVQFDHGCQQELKLWLQHKKSPVTLSRLIIEEASLRCHAARAAK